MASIAERPPSRASAHRLPDLLAPDLRVVFCGSAAGARSAAAVAYYAGPGNRFWPILHETGLTGRQLRPDEFAELLSCRIGLTDMAKHYAGADAGIRPEDDDPTALAEKIRRHRPQVLAFNGKRAAQTYFGAQVSYGPQTDAIGDTAVWVLPSTSAAARRWWDPVPWQALAARVIDARSRG